MSLLYYVLSILTSYQLSDAVHFPSADPGPVQNQFRRVWCNFLANILSMQRKKLRKKIERKKISFSHFHYTPVWKIIEVQPHTDK